MIASDFANRLNNFKQVSFVMHSWEIPKMQQNFDFNFRCTQKLLNSVFFQFKSQGKFQFSVHFT